MISPKDRSSILLRFAEEPHGTRHRYLSGCKCVPCRAANSRYSSERAAAQRAGDWRGFVPATLVLDHIKTLRKGGIGYKAVAAAAGLSRSTMQKIIGGKQHKIRKHHADRILAVDRMAIADCALIPADRTCTLLNDCWKRVITKNFLAILQRNRPCFDSFRECGPFDQFHYQVVGAHVVEMTDVGMIRAAPAECRYPTPTH